MTLASHLVKLWKAFTFSLTNGTLTYWPFVSLTRLSFSIWKNHPEKRYENLEIRFFISILLLNVKIFYLLLDLKDNLILNSTNNKTEAANYKLNLITTIQFQQRIDHFTWSPKTFSYNIKPTIEYNFLFLKTEQF